MKCSLGISNFLEESSSLSHCFVFLYFFALIAEEGFLISSCYSLEFCIQMLISSFSPLLFISLLFTAIYQASSHSHFTFLHFFFLGMVLVTAFCTMSQSSIPSTENCIKDLLSMAPPIRTRSSFPHSQSLPSGSFHKPSEGRKNENHNHRKLIKLITWTIALSNSMKL